ncbi:TonB-dependent receptor plug domain-containing protein [Qipengyuania sp. MTN3-11]|uniref:TonB-dependent receptor plug domain-containing protein n=1 Tax=Qipengyuania sp. MTN3-11 TaxID=3056557 RepID=UPI0036F3E487
MYKRLLLLTVFALPAAAQAQERSAPEDEIDTITVTATGLATDIANTGQAVAIVDSEEIDAVQGADPIRILRRLPGVNTVRSGPVGAQTSVFVRGAANEQLLVLIDGVRVADPASPSGGYDFGNLLATGVGKFDLLRGSNSTIWGSDAIGGVLDISTRGAPGLSGSLEYGARDTLTANATGGVSGDSYYAGLSANWFRTDGFSAAAGGTEPDGFEQFSLGGSGFLDLTPALELFVNGRYAAGELDIDGFPAPAFALADTAETQETEQYSGAVGLNYYGQDLTLRASYSLSDTERENFDRTVSDVPSFTSDGHSDRVSLRGEYRLIGGLTVAAGGEREWTSYETASDARAETAITGGYVQLGWVLGGLAAHVGGRIDDHERFGSEASFGGDLSYALGGGWRARASVGEGFKAPTLFQLFSDFGNRNLQPERSTSYDLGIERGSRGEGLHLAATAFRRDSEDLIAFVSCFGSADPICIGRPFGTYDNVARARAQGLEFEAGADLLPGLRLSAAATVLDAENRISDNDLARRPNFFATIFADYATSFGLNLGADLRLVGDSFENATNTIKLDGYEVLDLRASFDVTDRFELFGRVENVFDADYQTAAGYGTAGRGAFLGVRARM